MFSTLKYVNAPTMGVFRNIWNAKYLGGFVVHSKAFDGLKGEFPIGFLVWKTDQLAKKKRAIVEITTEVLDKHAYAIGEKCFYNLPATRLLTNWVKREKANKVDVIPLKNAITPATATKDLRGTKWSDNAIAYLWSNSNDVQQAIKTALFSSGFNGGHGFFVNIENLWQAAIVFSVRRLIKPTWLNDRDQFLQPTGELTDEFKNDCLVWMLFHGSNLSASANNLEWNGQKWAIVNHFIPFSEDEVGAPDRFESDFMVQYLAKLGYPSPQPSPRGRGGKAQTMVLTEDGHDDSGNSLSLRERARVRGLSEESIAVLSAGKKLWQAYFAHTDSHTVRDEYKLNRPDVGWYQIRNALKKRNESGDFAPVSFDAFEQAYKALTEKLRPMVYELGFLKQ
jgi:hypothetical protein